MLRIGHTYLSPVQPYVLRGENLFNLIGFLQFRFRLFFFNILAAHIGAQFNFIFRVSE